MTHTRRLAVTAAALLTLGLGLGACSSYYEPTPSARTPGEQNPWTTNAPLSQPPANQPYRRRFY